jgi:hypothetical protein
MRLSLTSPPLSRRVVSGTLSANPFPERIPPLIEAATSRRNEKMRFPSGLTPGSPLQAPLAEALSCCLLPVDTPCSAIANADWTFLHELESRARIVRRRDKTFATASGTDVQASRADSLT